MNPFDVAFFSAPDCIPCCGAAPVECACALLIPPFLSPFADYATAEGTVDDPLVVADCLAYQDGTTTDLTSFSVAVTATSIAASSVWSAAVGGFACWICVSAEPGETITITPSGGATDIAGTIYACDGTEIETFEEIGGAFTSAALTTGGVYYIYMNAFVQPPSSTTTTTATVTSSGVIFPNPVIALWDDSGTTRSLWACPKLLLPPLTEDTGDWYADCATADAVLTSDQVSNCVGYIESLTNIATFTATDGGTSLTLAETLTAGAMTGVNSWGGINGEAGETLTVTATVGAGTESVNVAIYDDAGALVEASGTTASPWTSAALTYTGRYTVRVLVTSDTNTTSLSAAITSSGAMSVNDIQARYDLTLTCPGTLDCGDTCP